MSQVTGSGGVVARKLTVGVEFAVNSQQANRALEDLAARAQQLQKNMTAAQQAATQLTYVNGTRVIGPAPGQPGPSPPGGPAGGAGGLGAMIEWGKPYAAIAGAAFAIQHLSQSLVSLGDSAKTAREKMAAYPVFGGAAASVHGAIDAYNRDGAAGLGFGRISDERAIQRHVTRPAEIATYADRLAQESAVRQLGIDAAARRDQINLGRQYGAAPGSVALLGGFALADDPRAAAAQEATRRARIERGAAALALARSQAPLDQAEARSQEQFAQPGEGGLMGEMNIAQATADLQRRYAEARRDPRAQQAFDVARRDLAEKQARGSADLAEYEKQIALAREKSINLAKADYDLARAKTGELKAQVQILEEQEQKVRGAARSFGAMAPHEQFQTYLDAKEYQRVGFGDLTPEQKQRLLADPIAGPKVAQDAEKAGAENPLFQELLKIFGQRSAEDLKAARVKLEQDIRFKVEFDEQKMRETIDKALKDFDQRVKDLIVKRAELAESKAKLESVQRSGADR